MRKTKIRPFGFIGPAFLFMVVVTIFPTVYAIYYSLHTLNLNVPQLGTPFIGLRNYLDLFRDPYVLYSFKLTGRYVLYAIPLQLIFGMGIALLMRTEVPGVRMIRGVLLIPMTITPIIVGYMWWLLLNSELGILPYYLSKIGVVLSRPLLGSPDTALWSIIAVDVWEWTPFVSLILYAGLQSVPVPLYEQASVDGATKWQAFGFITLPMIRQLILVAMIFRFVDIIRLFDIVFILTKGAPGFSTEVIGLKIYDTAFFEWNMGYAMAISLVILVVSIILGTILIRTLQRRGY